LFNALNHQVGLGLHHSILDGVTPPSLELVASLSMLGISELGVSDEKKYGSIVNSRFLSLPDNCFLDDELMHRHLYKLVHLDGVSEDYLCKCGETKTKWVTKIDMTNALPEPLVRGQIERPKQRRRIGGARWY